ncbi:inhibitory synaptic factor 1 [Tachysurus ichikawai]
MSKSQAPAQEPSEIPSQRERIRSHMKMVIEQLEGILIELKDVAKELREVKNKRYLRMEIGNHSLFYTVI